MTLEQLDDDLALVLMIGVPPYSPGDYLDVDDDGEFVTIRLADQFSRPLRLTPAEGLALLAAGRALLAVPGSDPEGPLATALGEAGPSPRPSRSRRCRRRTPAPRGGARRGRARASASRSTTGRRDATSSRPAASIRQSCSSRWASGTSAPTAIGPRRSACSASIASAASVRPASTSTRRPATTRSPTSSIRVPTIRASPWSWLPSAAWVAEAYPAESVTTRPDGTIEMVLAVSEPAWLERLLVRLGPEARVVAPETARHAGADAARRVLARYTEGRSDPSAHERA